MKGLIACEFSGEVRRAFAKRGVTVYSCDLLPADDGEKRFHLQCDVTTVLSNGWDFLIGFPPCTYLCNSGVRWLYEEPGRMEKMKLGALFFHRLWDAPVHFIALENPVMHSHAKRITKVEPSAVVHPWEHGHDETKHTCLWLKNLPPLVPTNILPSVLEDGRIKRGYARIHKMARSDERSMERSRTFTGIANAMAEQWLPVIKSK